jgi:hypothetical protein
VCGIGLHALLVAPSRVIFHEALVRIIEAVDHEQGGHPARASSADYRDAIGCIILGSTVMSELCTLWCAFHHQKASIADFAYFSFG